MLQDFNQVMLHIPNKYFQVLNVISLFVIIADLGFNYGGEFKKLAFVYLCIYLLLGIAKTLKKTIKEYNNTTLALKVFDIVSVLLIFGSLTFDFINNFILDDPSTRFIRYGVILKLIREFSSHNLQYKRSILNPSQLFIFSFFVLISVGTGLLLLPKSSVNGLEPIDALFTATSAVSVTGLSVIPIHSELTFIGQIIVLFLIQAGGIGVLTFASYLSYFFKGASSFENQIAISSINEDKIGDVFNSLNQIIGITFIIESIGALFIYFATPESYFSSTFEHIYFSIFHSISSFCNAGFSLMNDELIASGFKYQYNLQLVMALIFILGGLGFPIVVNLIRFVKHTFQKLIRRFVYKEHFTNKAWVFTFSSKLNIYTTIIVTVIGFVLFYIIEYNHILSGYSDYGKIVTAFFSSSTPRTAGYDVINYSQLQVSTLLIVIFLMWVGASPASTGGGIKTSTLAVAFLNFINLARGKKEIVVFNREIGEQTIRRAFATMTLSFLMIGLGTFVVSINERNQSFLNIVFETFSAYSTSGLSLGITSSLTDESKFILILLMFIGRVSMLTFLVSFLRQTKNSTSKYPVEEIMIN